MSIFIYDNTHSMGTGSGIYPGTPFNTTDPLRRDTVLIPPSSWLALRFITDNREFLTSFLKSCPCPLLPLYVVTADDEPCTHPTPSFARPLLHSRLVAVSLPHRVAHGSRRPYAIQLSPLENSPIGDPIGYPRTVRRCTAINVGGGRYRIYMG